MDAMRTAVALLVLFHAACAGLTPAPESESEAPQAPAPFSAAARVVDGELASDQDQQFELYGYRLGDAYLATWDAAGTVRVALRSQTPGAQLYVKDLGAGSDQQLAVAAGVPLKLWVASVEAVDGPYQLVFDPPPSKLLAPPRNDAAGRRERYLQLPVQKEFATDAARMESALRDELHSFQRDGDSVSARLEAFAGLELPVQADRCYRFVVRLGKDAAFSPIAQRGLRATFELHEGTPAPHSDLTVLGRSAILREQCLDAGGTARFKLATGLPSAANELGTGPLSVEVWTRPNGPFTESPAALEKAIARETRGYKLLTTQSGRLEDFHGLELPLHRGACYAMSVKLGSGASFSAEARKRRLANFHLYAPGVLAENEAISSGRPGVVGPGGVAQFGCPQRSGKGRFNLAYHDQVLGSGPITVQIFTRPIAEAELRRQARETRAAEAETARSIERNKAASCQKCIEEKIACQQRGGSGCYDGFLSCVRSQGFPRGSECGG